jgi:site-specific DNA-cytosine methylase
MRILIACEYSGVVREAFAKKGHEVTSCDILPSEIRASAWNNHHFTGDVKGILWTFKWDMIIAFPPCTHLAVSGSRFFKEKIADGRQQKAIDFFMMFANHDCPKIVIENPVGIMSTKWRKPDQIINPFQFGHPEAKKTCLWLKGVEKLKPTNVLELPECGHWGNQTKDKQNKLMVNGKWIGFNNPLTQKLRGKTYQGIADAMAEQWG